MEDGFGLIIVIVLFVVVMVFFLSEGWSFVGFVLGDFVELVFVVFFVFVEGFFGFGDVYYFDGWMGLWCGVVDVWCCGLVVFFFGFCEFVIILFRVVV